MCEKKVWNRQIKYKISIFDSLKEIKRKLKTQVGNKRLSKVFGRLGKKNKNLNIILEIKVCS